MRRVVAYFYLRYIHEPWKELKKAGSHCTALCQFIFSKPKVIQCPIANFEEKISSLQLSEEDLRQKIKFFFWISRGWLSVFLTLGIYAFSLLWQTYFCAFFSVLSLMCIAFGQFFRYDFWRIQIKKRELKINFLDWVKYYFD